LRPLGAPSKAALKKAGSSTPLAVHRLYISMRLQQRTHPSAKRLLKALIDRPRGFISGPTLKVRNCQVFSLHDLALFFCSVSQRNEGVGFYWLVN
jgi:uncharacterized protein (UPF0276 family)